MQYYQKYYFCGQRKKGCVYNQALSQVGEPIGEWDSYLPGAMEPVSSYGLPLTFYSRKLPLTSMARFFKY